MKGKGPLVGLSLILAAAVIALVLERMARADIARAANKLSAMLPDDAADIHADEKMQLPSPDRVQEAIGRKPSGDRTKVGDLQREVYTFGAIRKHLLYVYYRPGAVPYLVRYSMFEPQDQSGGRVKQLDGTQNLE